VGGNNYMTRSGANPLLLNRLSSDGDILSLMKDGTTVGSIGTDSSRFKVKSNSVALYLENESNKKLVWGNVSSVPYFYPLSDNDTNLGYPTQRFKDLYLSGGVKVGSYATELLDGGLKFKFNGGAFIDQNTVGQPLTFRVSNASSIDTTTMTLDSSGNVGIGTTSPDYLLEIETASSSVAPKLGFRNTQAGTQIGMPANTNALAFFTGDNERMRIDSSGNLLHNCTSQVSGGQYSAHFTGGTKDGIALKNTNAGNTGSFLAFFNSSTALAGVISQTGATTVSYGTSSDARLKDVTGEARGLEVINELNPVAYNWKADGKADEGLIAQEVLDIVPNAVSGSEEDMYQMDYSKLVTPLIKAVQELSAEVDELKQQIQNLKGE